MILNNDKQEIILVVPQCEIRDEIAPKILDLTIEYDYKKINISPFSSIHLELEKIAEFNDKYQVEIKIILNNVNKSKNEIKKYLNHLKTLTHNINEVQIIY